MDPTLQPRVGGLDVDHVRALQETPDTWPPLTVVDRDGRYLLVDGFHRYEAAGNLGLETVPARMVALPSDGDLHALAFSLNASHGRPLSLSDRRAFAGRLLRSQPGLSDREIGRRAGLSGNTVGALRERLQSSAQIEQTAERVGRAGYTYAVERKPGELPDSGLGDAVRDLFTPADRRRQRRVARYLERLGTALDDQYELEGWETHKDAADACRLTLGEERAAELARHLGDGSFNVLQVAIALGYDDNDQEG